MKDINPQPQLLHLVFGGELVSLESSQFKDLTAVEFVGVYPNYAEAHKAWKAAAQRTVDNAHMRYYVVHLHRLLDPALTAPEASAPTKTPTRPPYGPKT